MARLSGFNSGDQDADTGRGVFDPGQYTLQVVESDIVPNSKGTGMLLKITFEVYEGPQKGRKIWDNLSIEHQNVQTEEIAKRRLQALCDACGLPKGPLEDTEELHHIPFLAEVGVEGARPKPEGGEFAARNIVVRFILDAQSGKRGDGVETKRVPAAKPQAVAAAAPAAAKTASGGSLPWNRK